MKMKNSIVAAVATLVIAISLGCARVENVAGNVAVGVLCIPPSMALDLGTKIPAEPGVHKSKVVVNGVDRKVVVDIPEGYTGKKKVPVVMVFHGGGAGAGPYQRSRLEDILPTFRKKGWITVFPDGTYGRFGDGKHAWNAPEPECCGNAHRCEADDLGFIKQLLGRIERDLNVDDERVYAVGFSNGGMMVHSIMSTLSHRFSAAVTLSSSAGSQTKKNGPTKMVKAAKPIPMLLLHGMQDKRVPLDGSSAGAEVPSVSFQDSVTHWANNNGCNAKPKERSTGVVAFQTYTGCQADVASIMVDPLGHTWPTSENCGGFDCTEAIVQWLVKH